MVSTISAIKTAILTAIETTSIDKAYEGPVSAAVTTFPWAEVAFGGGAINNHMTSAVDREYQMVVRVHGSSVEQVEVALEEITVLWNTAAEFATFRAAGGLVLKPTSHYPPFVFGGSSSTQKQIYGDIDFSFKVRYT